MSKWMLLISAGMLVLATSCATNPTPQPTQASTATPMPTKVLVTETSAPTATATMAPTPTIAATSTSTVMPTATSAATLTATVVVAPTPTSTAMVVPTLKSAVTPTLAATATTASGSGTPVSGGDFTPKVRSVWNTAVGLDQMQGACANGSMLPVYGLVQITPNGNTLVWKNQEPAPYTMTKLQPNVYQYAGPTAIKDGVVTMTVTFISDKALEMNRVFVADADRGCTHNHVYTGIYQWDKP